MEFIKKV